MKKMINEIDDIADLWCSKVSKGYVEAKKDLGRKSRAISKAYSERNEKNKEISNYTLSDFYL